MNNELINTKSTQDTSVLIEELKLVTSDPEASTNFGRSVSITADGSRVAIGAYFKNEGGQSNAGAVYIHSLTNAKTGN